MSKSETMITDTGKAGEPAALTDKDLEAVTGGATPRLFEACTDGVHAPGHPNWIEIQTLSAPIGGSFSRVRSSRPPPWRPRRSSVTAHAIGADRGVIEQRVPASGNEGTHDEQDRERPVGAVA
jgi:hypothetical protein